jgi:hypothetical protein
MRALVARRAAAAPAPKNSRVRAARAAQARGAPRPEDARHSGFAPAGNRRAVCYCALAAVAAALRAVRRGPAPDGVRAGEAAARDAPGHRDAIDRRARACLANQASSSGTRTAASPSAAPSQVKERRGILVSSDRRASDRSKGSRQDFGPGQGRIRMNLRFDNGFAALKQIRGQILVSWPGFACGPGEASDPPRLSCRLSWRPSYPCRNSE